MTVTRLLWRLVSPLIGWLLHLGTRAVEATLRVTVRGAPPSGAAVFVLWHKHLPYLIPFFGRRGSWMLVSRAPYMQSIALWCELSGLKLIRGASGEDGQAAVAELAARLRAGESLALAVDGPAGPAREVKRGCLELSLATGAPIVPVSYSCAHGRPNPWRWDRSLVPWPFDRVTVEFGAPLSFTAADAGGALARIKAELDRLDTGRPWPAI